MAPKAPKAPTFYPADDVPVKVPSARELASKGIAKLRKSITPGTVLILLAGRFRGRRVVFLKQLPSGLLLVSGPYQVNGIPLRRVNQAYVIATSTKVDVSKADVSKFEDTYFGKTKTPKSKKGKEDFLDGEEAVRTRPGHDRPSRGFCIPHCAREMPHNAQACGGGAFREMLSNRRRELLARGYSASACVRYVVGRAL